MTLLCISGSYNENKVKTTNNSFTYSSFSRVQIKPNKQNWKSAQTICFSPLDNLLDLDSIYVMVAEAPHFLFCAFAGDCSQLLQFWKSVMRLINFVRLCLKINVCYFWWRVEFFVSRGGPPSSITASMIKKKIIFFSIVTTVTKFSLKKKFTFPRGHNCTSTYQSII